MGKTCTICLIPSMTMVTGRNISIFYTEGLRIATDKHTGSALVAMQTGPYMRVIISVIYAIIKAESRTETALATKGVGLMISRTGKEHIRTNSERLYTRANGTTVSHLKIGNNTKFATHSFWNLLFL